MDSGQIIGWFYNEQHKFLNATIHNVFQHRCLDHSTLVCQHCLIFGEHRGDNAQTVEHRFETKETKEYNCFKCRAYVGRCWDSLRKAREQISTCKEALVSMERVEREDELVEKIMESLAQYQEEQIESLVRIKLKFHHCNFCVCRLSDLTPWPPRLLVPWSRCRHLS